MQVRRAEAVGKFENRWYQLMSSARVTAAAVVWLSASGAAEHHRKAVVAASRVQLQAPIADYA